MTATISRSQVDLYQGDDEQGRAFGYVCGEDGGFFFTWLASVEDTLASVEEDEVDSNGGLSVADVTEFLRGYLPATKRGRQLWTEAAE